MEPSGEPPAMNFCFFVIWKEVKLKLRWSCAASRDVVSFKEILQWSVVANSIHKWFEESVPALRVPRKNDAALAAGASGRSFTVTT